MKIKVNGTDYQCKHFTTHINDYSWDGRDNQELLLEMSHAEANSLFINDVSWGYYTTDEEGAEALKDCSEYSVAGDITDHRNGTISVRMGKLTEADKLKEELDEVKEKLNHIWKAGEAVKVGDRRFYNGKWYVCIQAHTTQADWTPDVVPALWSEE